MRGLILLIVSMTVATCFRHTYRHHARLRRYPKVTEVKAVPVVLWHGMGDSCCNPLSMGSIKALIQQNVKGVYVKSLMFGHNIASDVELGFVANVNELVKNACEQIRNDSQLQFGYNAIGFSQGAQFLRAVAQRCPDPPMKNLISVGGQHQGIFGMPYCLGDWWLCNAIRKLLDIGAYKDYIQKRVVQAQYWHDPYHEEEYKNDSIFLADINNERAINPDYKKNLLKLKNILLIMFKQDEMVVPKESSWFGFYKEGQLDVILSMNQTRLYKEDRIGLKKLYETGRLHFLAVEGNHLKIRRDEFVKEVIEKFLI
ncbi:Palmitoyl-protein thioesterase 1 [Parelaphostrongylus tenuis]|uniref:Palmitoyl-protein thioesterase 1 n=1 Tax=Parelaphostrongylus tenuis TaxID=148309 RepID=A0AAD5MTH3_PARTN|nr:Palmitoyl-protein thioesterase 1 [Parelaphostrongylus tenuis]